MFAQISKRNQILSPPFVASNERKQNFHVGMWGRNGTIDDPLEKQWHISLRIQRYISNQTLKKEEKVGAMTDDVNEVNLTAM